MRPTNRPVGMRPLLGAVLALCVLLGGAGTWLAVRDGDALQFDPSALLWCLLAAPPLLVVHLGLRFLRWHLLVRGTGLLLPERRALRVFLSSFAFNFVPLAVGPAIYRILALGRELGHPTDRRRLVAATVAEGLYDLLALSLIGLLGLVLVGERGWGLAPLLAIAALLLLPTTRDLLALSLAALLNLGVRLIRRSTSPIAKATLADLFRARFPYALLLSLAAWSAPVVLLVGLTAFDDLALAPAAAAAFAESSLGGLASPGGAGLSGNLLADALARLGAATTPESIILFRVGTFWLALAAGVAVLAGSLLVRRRADAAPEHFNEIAAIYDAEIPPALRDRLVERKTATMIAMHTPPGGWRGARGLDLGCGQGRYAERMAAHGVRMTGVDASHSQLSGARSRIADLAVSFGEALPFADGSFDVVYSINVLHHLPSREAQEEAFREIRRVLRPGGALFLHEINTLNPLFRFYMGYVFPVLREIDTGIELWIRPTRWESLGGWMPARVEYYTFLPDFVPESLASALRPIERRLETSPLARFSAHYTALFIRD